MHAWRRILYRLSDKDNSNISASASSEVNGFCWRVFAACWIIELMFFGRYGLSVKDFTSLAWVVSKLLTKSWTQRFFRVGFSQFCNSILFWPFLLHWRRLCWTAATGQWDGCWTFNWSAGNVSMQWYALFWRCDIRTYWKIHFSSKRSNNFMNLRPFIARQFIARQFIADNSYQRQFVAGTFHSDDSS